MKIIIIEDEKPAFERLSNMVKKYDDLITISENLKSVKESIKWFNSNKQPDLILLDIQLSDGLSLDIFNHCKITCPVIFTTAYDEYILEAFSYNGIDYLLKPIKKDKLEAALEKYKNLKKHFTHNFISLFDQLSKSKQKYKERITVKSGTDFISIRIDEIAYFYTEYKLVFLIASSGKKYLVNKKLSELEEELNPSIFFRINRKYLVNINAITKFKSFFKGKLIVNLKPKVEEEIIISQEKASIFKEWIEE